MKNFLPLILSIFLISPVLLADPVEIFREDWAETPWALPITQEHVANADLQLNLYGGAVGGGEGDAAYGLKKSHHDEIANDPYYVWTGEIQEAIWGASLGFKDARSFDLSGDASLSWRTRQSGDNCLHIILRTLGGDWLISEATNCATSEWQITTHVFSSLTWKLLDADRIDFAEAVDISEVDLSKIVEVGFTDMMVGASSAQSSRIDWLEVTGHPRPTVAIAALSTGSLLHRKSVDLSNDGNLGTHWFAEGDNQYLKAELEEASMVNGVEIAWWKNRERTSAFEVEVSSDGSSWTTVLPEMNTEDVARDFEYYPLPEEIEAKFIRVIGHGNTANGWNSIAELRILGESLSIDWYEAYPLVAGWRNVDWFGFIYADQAPWILHTGLSWIYMMASEEGSFYIWDYAIGWLYTSDSLYPTLYSYGIGKWYMFSSGPDPRWFYNLTDGVWESL